MDSTTPAPESSPLTSVTPSAEPTTVQPSPSPAPDPIPPAAPPSKSAKKNGLLPRLLASGMFCLVIGVAVGFGLGHYVMNPATEVADTKTQTPQAKTLEVPKDATVIAECAVGRGKQYVLPKDIPTGPVYNVWDNKVIGVEFMVGRDELLSENKTFVNLPLGGVVYDHANIGLLSQGHSGFPQPHYHVDLFTISNDEAQKITCK